MLTIMTARAFSFDPCKPATRVLFALAATGALLIATGCKEVSEPASKSAKESEAMPQVQASPDPRNTSYVIEGTMVRLVDGVAEEPAAPGSSSRTITRIWGEPTLADLNADGTDDAMLVLTQSSGGSGTFYYLAAAIASPEGHSGTAGLLLGDRIVPSAIDVHDGRVRVRFMTRGVGESFADDPTIEKTRSFVYAADGQQLAEVAHEFEGEADPDRMALEMKTWTWIKTSYNDDTVKQPTQKEAFTLSFEDGTVRGTTDCNRFSGAYTADKHRIEFAGEMATTRMFCAESQEGEFVEMLANVTSYLFTSRGQLILELAYDSGGMEFR